MSQAQAYLAVYEARKARANARTPEQFQAANAAVAAAYARVAQVRAA